MDQTDKSIENDVLHSENPTKLSPEEIAKAVAHHNRHHSGENPETTPDESASGQKNAPRKSK